MRGRPSPFLLVWLLFAAAAQSAAFLAVWRLFLFRERGQLLDAIAFAGNHIGADQIESLVSTVLNAMSLLSLAIATAVIGFIALIRGRVGLAVMATVLIVGANATTQVLKYILVRPDLGLDGELTGAGNSLPSGHTTVAMSVAVAAVLVLPRQLRGTAAVVGGAYAALAGVATLSAGWHRPSDAVAAVLVVGAWASVVGLVLALMRRPDDVVRPEDAHRRTLTVLALTGVVLLAAAAVNMGLTDGVRYTPTAELGRWRLFIAYSGAAAWIAGVTCAVMALVLATAHQVVPRRGAAARDGQPVVAESAPSR